MPEQDDQRKRHFILEATAETEPFSRRGIPITPPEIPDRDRQQHGGSLLNQIC
jgi:hypothetical protein